MQAKVRGGRMVMVMVVMMNTGYTWREKMMRRSCWALTPWDDMMRVNTAVNQTLTDSWQPSTLSWSSTVRSHAHRHRLTTIQGQFIGAPRIHGSPLYLGTRQQCEPKCMKFNKYLKAILVLAVAVAVAALLLQLRTLPVTPVLSHLHPH